MNLTPDAIELLNVVYSAAQYARLSAQERRRVQVAYRTLLSRLQSLPASETSPEVGVPAHASEDQNNPSLNSEEIDEPSEVAAGSIGSPAESPSEDQSDPSPNPEEVI